MNKSCEQHLKDTLKENPSCCVLVTCQEANENGEMIVEMSYTGDVILASYLLASAQSVIDEEDSFESLPEDQTTNIQLVKNNCQI